MIKLEPLTGHHNRGAFDCGAPALNAWLKQTALQHQGKGISRTFVAVPADQEAVQACIRSGYHGVGESSILGYYALASAFVTFEQLPKALAKRYPRQIPVTRLGRLAVCTAMQAQGLGELLLLDAIGRARNAAQQVGSAGLFVDAKDAKAARFYEKYGFQPSGEQALTLYLTLWWVIIIFLLLFCFFNSSLAPLFENGQVWWRILTMTGSYSVGTDQVIAWVRGTSINLAKTGATDVTLTWDAGKEEWIKNTLWMQNSSVVYVIDTTMPGYAADVYCQDGNNIKLRQEESLVTNGTCPPLAISANAENIFATNTWIKQNTYEDLGYMRRIIDPSGSGMFLAFDKQSRILDELITTLPNNLELVKLISSSGLDDATDDTDIATPINLDLWDFFKLRHALVKAKQVECRGENKYYWNIGVSPTSMHGWCEDKNVIAVADYSGSYDSKIYFYRWTQSGANDGSPPNPNLDGIEISSSGQYISYWPLVFPGGYSSLSGKTVTIELANPVWSGLPPLPVWTKAYIADLGTEQWFVVNNWRCTATDTLWTYLCKKVWAKQTNAWAPWNPITLTISTTPTQIIIGNTSTLVLWQPYQLPVWTTIKKISISN